MCASRHGCARRIHDAHVPTEMHHSAMLQPKHMRTPRCIATLPTMHQAQCARRRLIAHFPRVGESQRRDAPVHHSAILQAHHAQTSSTRCTVPMMCRSGAVPSCHPCSPCAMRTSSGGLKLIRLHRCLLCDAAVHRLCPCSCSECEGDETRYIQYTVSAAMLSKNMRQTLRLGR